MTESELMQNKIMKERFLDLREIPKEYKFNDPNDYFCGYIYCIENLKDGRKYIGSTYAVYSGVKNPGEYHAVRKRASQYIHEYKKYMHCSKSTLIRKRPIIQALVLDGIENFVMYPIAETGMKTHFKMEMEFINKWNTIKNGYNLSPLGNPSAKRMVTTEVSADKKTAISSHVMCINLGLKQIVMADSMKLFADYMGTTKDQIKNNARSGRTYKGWFIFYRDSEKRNEILYDKVLGDKLGIQKRGNSRNHSERSKAFYRDLVKDVNEFLYMNPNKVFSDFKIVENLTY